LYRGFATGLTNAPFPSGVQYVVDGGYLLHKVRWRASQDVSEILPLFRNYLHKLGPSVEIVFDGYSGGASTKDHEHVRRTSKVSHVAPERQVEYSTKELGPQEPFLANTSNKKSFIAILMNNLEQNGFTVHQAKSDADTMIVSVALHCASHGSLPVAVLAEDTDIFVLLLHHRKLDMTDIYFVCETKRGKAGKMTGGKCISISAVQEKIGRDACDDILVIHALGGCDTTSAIFGHGKGTIFNKITRERSLHVHCMNLQSVTASEKLVCTSGIQLLIALYGGKDSGELASLRYAAYCNTSLSHRFQPERLPPAKNAARMHVMRVHVQVVVWGTLDETDLIPTDWGWKLQGNILVPIQSTGKVAPDHVLRVVRCKCKSNCQSALCSCRKHGLHCVSACSNCHGTDCTNVKMDVADTYGSDSDSEPDIPEAFVRDSDTDIPDFLLDDDLYFEDEEEI